jgi:hypothetical protein
MWFIYNIKVKINKIFIGIKKIENLDEYTNLNTIWFQNNCISLIENL